MIQSDAERQAPLTVDAAEASHLIRYVWSTRYIANGHTVLDAPCGSGYGTAVLAAKAVEVYGIDIDRGAVTHANELFKRDTNRFSVGDIEDMTGHIDDSSIDRIVSFEGIEHLQRPERFLSEARRVVKPGGYMIISTPRKPHGSPYHIKEYSLEEFRQELEAHFHVQEMFGQVYTTIAVLDDSTNPDAHQRFNFIALCRPK